jgi:hypothetical protein
MAFSPLPYHIGVVPLGSIHPKFRAAISGMRGRLPLRQELEKKRELDVPLFRQQNCAVY